MKFFSALRKRFSEALTRHPQFRDDPILGRMEQAGAGLWQTTEPIEIAEGAGPISVMVEGEAAPDPASDDAFNELRRRYSGLKASIAPTLCKAAPRVRSRDLWQHAWLASVEIWRHPVTRKSVFALEYQLDDDPEYAYIVRIENWRAVDVLVVG